MPLVPIQLNSNRPRQIVRFFDHLEATAEAPQDIEVLVHFDEGDTAMEDVLAHEKTRRRFTLKTLQTDLIDGPTTLWKPLNPLFQLTDPEAYFVINVSDEMLFETKGWDSMIRRYVGYFPDDIFRLRASKYRFHNYTDYWQCGFAPDSLAFYTRRWLELGGDWNPCLGPDSFQQCVAFYLYTSDPFSHRQFNRDVPLPDMRFSGEGAGIGLIGPAKWRYVIGNNRAWFILMSHRIQQEARRRAMRLKAHILAHAHGAEVIENPAFRLFTVLDRETGNPIEAFSYKLSRLRITLINGLRAPRVLYYAGGGNGKFGWHLKKSIQLMIGTYLLQSPHGAQFLAWLEEREGAPKAGWRIRLLRCCLPKPAYAGLRHAYRQRRDHGHTYPQQLRSALIQRLPQGMHRAFQPIFHEKHVHGRTYLQQLRNWIIRHLPRRIHRLLQRLYRRKHDHGHTYLWQGCSFTLRLLPQPVYRLCLLLYCRYVEWKRRRTLAYRFYSNVFIPGTAHVPRLCHLLARIGLIPPYVVNAQGNLPPPSPQSDPQPLLPIALTFMDDMDNPKKVLAFREEMPEIAGHVRLLYDLSAESLDHAGSTGKKLDAFHAILREAGVDNRRIYLIDANYNAAAAYKRWLARSPHAQYPIHIGGYNFYLFEYFCELNESAWFQAHKHDLLSIARRTAAGMQMRDKHFMCLNLRPRTHRWAIMLHLLERGWLEKGMVSFFGEEFGQADASSVASTEDSRRFVASLPSGPRLLPYFDRLRDASPITLERSPASMRKDLWQRKAGEVNFLFPEAEPDGTMEDIASYFEIVTETWFSGANNLYITEKTIRPIVRLQPFIHVGTPHVLRYLRRIGFKTFAPYIDERYDAITDKARRMEAIFREIDRLCAMPKEEIHALYAALLPVLEHNFHHFIRYTPRICEQETRRLFRQLGL